MGDSNITIEVNSIEECMDKIRNDYPEANGAMIETFCVENCTCWAMFNMTNIVTDDGRNFWASCIFIDENTVDCQDGDGFGGTEVFVDFYTKEEDYGTCIEEVRNRYPNANGVKNSKYCGLNADLSG